MDEATLKKFLESNGWLESKVAPDGYSSTEGFELYTGGRYGEQAFYVMYVDVMDGDPTWALTPMYRALTNAGYDCVLDLDDLVNAAVHVKGLKEKEVQ